MSNHQRGIQTVEFAGEILQLVCNSPKSLSLSEIAESMQLAPGSAYKYLVSLLRTGLLKRNEITLEFEAGPLSLRMGLAKIQHDLTLKHARQALTHLAEKYQLNVFASMWSKHNGPTVVFYKQTGGFFHIGFRLGIRLSLTQTASGRLFAAHLDQKTLELYGDSLDNSEQELLQTPQFIQTIDDIRAIGYSKLYGTPTPGISSFSIPVFNEDQQFVMAITAFQKAEMLRDDVEHNIIHDLKNIALELKEIKYG